MEKNKILGIISIILFIIGWIAYSKLGIVLAIIIEIGAFVLAIISGKKQKNAFATIGLIGSTILIVMMIVILLGNVTSSKVGEDSLIRKSQEIQQAK